MVMWNSFFTHYSSDPASEWVARKDGTHDYFTCANGVRTETMRDVLDVSIAYASCNVVCDFISHM
jgi:hypothetical protein